MFGRPPRRKRSVEGARFNIAASSRAMETAEELYTLLDDVDAAALAIYAAHELPNAPGHYRQPPNTLEWEHLGVDLSPAEKWALLEQHPTSDGWRYGSREQLGAHSPVAAVRYASALLSACQGLRQKLKEGSPLSAQSLADAIRLGAAWRRLAPDEG